MGAKAGANESKSGNPATGYASGNHWGNLWRACGIRRVPASPRTDGAALQVREVGKFTGCSRFPKLLEGGIDRTRLQRGKDGSVGRDTPDWSHTGAYGLECG